MKGLLVFLFALCSLSLFSQIITHDQYQTFNGQKTRIILTSIVPVRSITDRIVHSIGLNVMKSESGKQDYFISVEITSTKKISILNDSKLLLKLNDDSIIELGTSSEYSKTEFDDYLYQLKTKYPVYSIVAFYFLNEQQLEQMMSGVKKMRVESSIGILDKEFKKDQIGKVLQKGYVLINKALERNDDIYNDF